MYFIRWRSSDGYLSELHCVLVLSMAPALGDLLPTIGLYLSDQISYFQTDLIPSHAHRALLDLRRRLALLR